MSGGLDSQLAVRVLQNAGAYVEAVCFSTPFFDISAAKKAAEALGVKLHVIDFTDDEFGIVDYPSPAGGCKLTEEGFCRKLKDLQEDARRRAQDL